RPSAAARVLLPMTLAFNIRVPRGGWWPLLLVAGNLGIFGSASLLRPEYKTADCCVVEGPRELRLNPEDGYEVGASFETRNWWPAESEGRDYWHWSKGDCRLVIHNPRPFTVVADVTFGLATADPRGATATIGGRVAWRSELRTAYDNQAAISGLELPPGDTAILFQSDRPAASPEGAGGRLLMYSVRDLK